MPSNRQPFTVVALAGLLAVLSVLTPGCGEEPSATIRPGISLMAENGGRLDGLSFGEVPLGGTHDLKFLVKSTNRVALDVRSIEIVADDGESAIAFTAIPSDPFVVPALGTSPMTIRFQPREVRRYQARLLIRSGDPRNPEVQLALVGDGVAGRLEVLACLPNTAELPARCADTLVSPPDALSLGDVTAGAHAAALVTLRNGGGEALAVSSVAFADPEAASAAGFALQDGVGGGMNIPSREAGSFTVNFNPPAGTEGSAAATLVIESDSVTDPRVQLELQADVVPNQAPEACLFVREIRHADGSVETFAPGDTVPLVEPTDVVIVDAKARVGCTGDPEDGEDVTPDIVLTAPRATSQLRSVSGESLVWSLEAEATGTYEITLTVSDSLGRTASADAAGNPATVTIQVVPRRDVAVEISWEGDPLVDVDLHFVRGTTSNLWSSTHDAYWDNPSPDWGVGGDLFDNPALILDDLGTGSLVETAVLNRPEAGQSYWVYARMNRDDRNRSSARTCTVDGDCTGGLVCSMGSATEGRCMEPVDVGLKVFLQSAEFDLSVLPGFQNPRALKSPCDTWLAGRVLWPSGNGAPIFDTAGADILYPDGTPQGNVCSTQ